MSASSPDRSAALRLEIAEEPAEVMGLLGGAGRPPVHLLHGARARSMTALYDVLVDVLEFPAYFGRNLGALDEVLADPRSSALRGRRS